MTALLTAKTLIGTALCLVMLGLSILTLTGPAAAGEPFLDREGRPVGGHDVVSYHTEDVPLEGLESLTADHNGVTWYFATEANRALFVADPERYVPAYDGHCAYALADGRKVRSDPLAYRIVDGVLYMNFSPSVQARWEQDIPGYLERSEANWPALESAPAARPGRWF